MGERRLEEKKERRLRGFATSWYNQGRMNQLEEIKSKIDIVEFISEFVPLKKAGRNFKAICPFHTEKTPSFIVSPERQIWHCFGCGRGGDIFGFLMEIERIEFGEALRILAKRAGVVLESYRPTGVEAEKEKILAINSLAAEFYHYLLLNHQIGKRALEYAYRRGMTKESLERFKVGYAPPMWDGLQKFLIGRKGYSVGDLDKAGLVVQSSKFKVQSYYDRFRDRLMFPLSDHRGNVVGFAGRLLDPNAKEAKYVNTPETLVYHKSELLYPLQITKEEIKKENSVVVVEGEIDAISCYQVGVKNVVAIKGSALTEAQSRLLKRFAENVVLSLDSDAAGDAAMRRGIEIASNLGLNVKVAVLEKYKDPDEAAQKEPDYLKEKITQAEGVYDFYIDSAFKRFGGRTPEEKRKIGQELVPIWARIEDEILKDVYVKRLAERLGVSEESIILQMEKVKDRFLSGAKKETTSQQKKERRDLLEEYLLSLIFQAKKTELLLEEEWVSLFVLPINKRIIEALRKFLSEKKKFSSKFFFRELPAELKEAFDHFYLTDFGEQIEDEEWVEKELKKIQKHLRIMATREELERLSLELRKRGEDEKIAEQISKLTRELKELESFSR